MSIIIKLRDYQHLPEAENVVRKYILKNMSDTIEMNIYQVAEAAYSSPASIVRLCQRMGLKGFSDLKLEIAKDIRAFEEIGLSTLDTTILNKDDTSKDIIDKLTEITIQSIEETRLLLNEHTLEEVAKEIVNTKYLDFYGVGSSNIVAMDAAIKFMRIGKAVSFFQLYDRQLVQAINANKDHLGVIISYSGETKEMIKIAENLQQNGSTIITITGTTKNTLASLADHSFMVSNRESLNRSGAIASRTSQLFLLDVLYAITTNLNYDEHRANIAKTVIQYEE